MVATQEIVDLATTVAVAVANDVQERVYGLATTDMIVIAVASQNKTTIMDQSVFISHDDNESNQVTVIESDGGNSANMVRANTFEGIIVDKGSATRKGVDDQKRSTSYSCLPYGHNPSD